ncbi:hypothetical protein [Leptolyngbya sp. FACHB-17]|nr:hypothetical protein [Leptolyngbya sp. FACHB-17]MBD2079071.1 hypothetical protein [Leptolyngbya sp. FACHB-17]
MEDNTKASVCVGTFDQFGMPIALTKHLSEPATVAFQVVTLNVLLASSLGLEVAETTVVHHRNGSCIRIERTLKGFTASLSESDSVEPTTPKP